MPTPASTTITPAAIRDLARERRTGPFPPPPSGRTVSLHPAPSHHRSAGRPSGPFSPVGYQPAGAVTSWGDSGIDTSGNYRQSLCRRRRWAKNSPNNSCEICRLGGCAARPLRSPEGRRVSSAPVVPRIATRVTVRATLLAQFVERGRRTLPGRLLVARVDRGLRLRVLAEVHASGGRYPVAGPSLRVA